MTALEPWDSMINVWRSGQERLATVRCWSAFDCDKNGGIRPQDLLQHSYSLAVLGRMVISLLRPHATLDESLLMTALLLHDHGKAEIGFDPPAPSKSDWSQLREYYGFISRFSHLPAPVFHELERAFLLQCATLSLEHFPEDARNVVEQLKIEHPLEVLAFEAIERWDFVLYALEQYRERQNEMILSRVLRNHESRLDELAASLPGFGTVIWTPEIQAWKADFLKQPA
ncbi:MAG: hypothetical protein Q7R83_01490 [bacterium]|nr:hypothetical protein [bacterium]